MYKAYRNFNVKHGNSSVNYVREHLFHDNEDTTSTEQRPVCYHIHSLKSHDLLKFKRIFADHLKHNTPRVILSLLIGIPEILELCNSQQAVTDFIWCCGKCLDLKFNVPLTTRPQFAVSSPPNDWREGGSNQDLVPFVGLFKHCDKPILAWRPFSGT